eukprot:TRINITY_DN28062_c0_g2_i2.p2 TRINITY_DN28062_c0_g2~~TRINITY_DN28062_c0_g2_i2.p2  ORF type:complete len:154 (+),score=31.36 TRINITY_DN28062_c0_g2_i2:322-783(+)
MQPTWLFAPLPHSTSCVNMLVEVLAVCAVAAVRHGDACLHTQVMAVEYCPDGYVDIRTDTATPCLERLCSQLPASSNATVGIFPDMKQLVGSAFVEGCMLSTHPGEAAAITHRVCLSSHQDDHDDVEEIDGVSIWAFVVVGFVAVGATVYFLV